MDSSDKDKLQAEKLKIDEAEHTEIEETCQEKKLLDASLGSPVKEKSESGFEITSKRSTDNVGKESDENVIKCANRNDIVLAEDNLKKSEQHSSSVTLPDNTNETIKEGKNWVDQINTNKKNTKTLKETHSTTHESSVSTCSSVFDLSESYISKTEISTDSESFEIDGSCKKETKMIEPLSEIKVTELSKFEEIESFPMRNQVPFDTPISSTVKRKSQQIFEDEIKRKRSTYNLEIEVRNDEIVTDISNVQDVLEKPEKCLESTAISINTTGSGIKQDPINQTDQSAITYTRIKSSSETDLDDQTNSEVCNISKSSKHSSSEKGMQQQKEIARGIGHINPTFISLEDFDPNLVQSRKQILEPTSNQRTSLISMESELPENQSDKTLETDSATIREVKDTSRLKKFYKQKNPAILQTKSAIDRPSTSKMEPIIDSEDEVHIDDVDEEYDESEIGFEETSDVVLTDAMLVGFVLKYIEDEGREIIHVSEEEFNARRDNLRLILEKDLLLLKDYQENMEQLAEVDYEESVQEMLENNERPPNPVVLEDLPPDTLVLTQNPNKSPDSEPPENQQDKTSGADSAMIKEVKDTRYLKKFYKRKNSVQLPTNSAIDQPSTSKVEPNIDSEEKEKQITRNDLQIVSKSSESMVHEEFEDRKSSEHASSEKVLTHQEVTAKVFQPEEKLEKDQMENPKIKEICSEKKEMVDTPVRLPAKRKSKSCCEIKSKRSMNDVEEYEENTETGFEERTEDERKVLSIDSQLIGIVLGYMRDLEREIINVTRNEFKCLLDELRKELKQNPDLLKKHQEDMKQEIPENNAKPLNLTVSRSRSIVHEKPNDSKIILKDENLLKEKRKPPEDESPETSASASRNSIFMQAENPIEVKKHDKYLKGLDKKKPESADRSHKEIKKMHNESTNRSNSPERNNEGTSAFKSEDEGLAARMLEAVSSSQPPPSARSPSRPPPPAHSPSRPPPPAHSPSRKPPAAASPSRPPPAAASPSRPPPAAASPSLTK